MDGMRGPSDSDIVQWGSMADTALDVFVATQGAYPANFRDLTEILMNTDPGNGGRRDFFLAITLATAIIRLAATGGVSK